MVTWRPWKAIAMTHWLLYLCIGLFVIVMLGSVLAWCLCRVSARGNRYCFDEHERAASGWD